MRFSRSKTKTVALGSNCRGGNGRAAFALMHELLDAVWLECNRVMKPGAIACVNIGDATRTLDGDFQLYSNHSRILSSFLGQGFAALPDILWRKANQRPQQIYGVWDAACRSVCDLRTRVHPRA